ncbi:MAG: hypothetical protein ABIQ09_02540 [Jatrophihabitantaceae bacterium]
MCLVLPVLATPGGAVTAGASSATAIGSPGVYSAVNRVRALDSRVSGAIPAKATTKVKVTGLGSVPATDVVAISVNLTVLTPAVTGSVTAFADGTSWSGATMSFQAGQTDQNFETVPVGASGLINIRNNTSRSLLLIVDVLGYHTSGLGDYFGEYQPMTPTRLLDTRTGQPVAAGQTRTFGVGGRAGIPARGDFDERIGVVVNVTVLTPSRSGSLTVGTTDLAVKTSTMSFAAGQTEQGQLLELLDGSGGLAVRNNSAAAVQVIADVVGYYTGLSLTDPGRFDHFIAGGHWRVYDSRAAGQAPVQPGSTVELPIVDLANGNTRDGICAPLMNVTVLTPSTGGSISVWPDSIVWDGAATITFAAHQTRQRMLLVASGDKENVQIRNNSSAAITLIVDVKGWRSCV